MEEHLGMLWLFFSVVFLETLMACEDLKKWLAFCKLGKQLEC